MLDPDSIQALQGFASGFAQNLIASVIVEGKKTADDKHAQEAAKQLQSLERKKPLETRIVQTISTALRQLDLNKQEFDLLLPLASDDVFATEFAKQILADRYSQENVAKLIVDAAPSLDTRRSEILRLASLLVGAIQSSIAHDPHLHRAKQLQSQVRLTEDIADFRSEVTAGILETQDAINQLHSKIGLAVGKDVRSALADSYQGVEHLKSSNQKRFDRARAELMNGSIHLAEKAYRELAIDLESQGSLADPALLFRTFTNLGSSLWHQFRRDEAVLWFERAYQTKPDEPKAKTNRGLCYLHRGDFNGALSIWNEVRCLNTENFEPVYFISCAYVEQGDLARAVSLLEERIFDTEGYYVALSECYLRQENFEKATAAARKALSMDANCTQALVALGNSLGFPFVLRRMRGELVGHSLERKEHEQVIEAIAQCEAAANTLRTQEHSFQLGEVLTNLSAFQELAGNDERAAQVAANAAELAPRNPIALANHWASLMRRGKFTEAYSVAGRLMAVGDMAESKLRQLESLLANSECERLLKEADQDPGLAADLQKEAKFFELKARAHFELHSVDDAFATLGLGLSLHPCEGLLLVTRASFHEELGQLDDAGDDIRAAESSPTAARPRIIVGAAMFFYRKRNWAPAAERFEKLGGASIYSPFLKSFLTCLYNQQEFQRCYTLAKEAIKATSKFDEGMHELAARCAYNLNELPAAEKLLDQLVRRETKNVYEYQKMLAQVYLRLDEVSKAKAVLKKALAFQPKDVHVLISLSFVASLQKAHSEALRYSLTAVEAAPKNARAHMAFVSAALKCPPSLKVEQKHHKAFQGSIEFLNKHPSGYVKAVPIEQDLKSLTAMLKARAEYAHKMEDLVRSKNLPMAFLAEQLKISSFQTWLGLIGHSNLHVHMAYGTIEEQTTEVQHALNASAVCMDAFALLTLGLLNLLDLLPKLFAKVFVHSALLESVAREIHEMEVTKTAFAISYREGKLIRSEVSAEQVEKQIVLLRDIRAFLKSPVVELVGVDPRALSNSDSKTACKVLGAAHYGVILMAKERTASYYADDASMRSLASNSHGLASFCTQALLRAAKEKGLLTTSQYEGAVVALLRHNYDFVSESSETLGYLVGLEQFEPSELSKRMLERISDPRINQDTCIRILSDFTLFLWRADFTKAKVDRETWLGLCVDAMMRAKQPEKLFPQFLVNLGIRALTQPDAFGGITHCILRSGQFSKTQHAVFFISVQHVILQMLALAEREFPWWGSLSKQWSNLVRINILLDHNRWI